MTQKQQIDDLMKRMTALEERMTAPAKTQQQVNTTYLRRTSTQNTPAPPVQLQVLTPEEEAFCKKFGINALANKQSIQLQAKQLTEADKQALHTFKQKRLHTITIFN